MTEPRNRNRPWLLALLALTVALVLAACATAGPPDDGAGDDETAPGALVVDINGLPSGAQGDVDVTGPTFSETIGASETFVGLSPGTYVVSASDVSFEGVDYDASVSGSPADVVSGGVATVTVIYVATSTAPGDLTVEITGLPVGVDADVNVTGPSGFDENLVATATFEDVEVGIYTTTAADVTDGTDVYAATITGSPATVPAGGSATITVAYTFLDPTTVGTLDVDISGLPDGVDAAVNVSGTGVDEDLTASTSLAGLAPGNYVVTGADVVVGDLIYAAIVTTSPALVLPEETTTVDVLYQPFVPDDGDAASEPGVFALFRATSPAPVSVDEMLFNEANPIDTKGIELRNELAEPADPGDWLAFELVHGQGNTTSITISLECGTDLAVGSVIRAELRDADGAKLGTTITCDTARDIAVPNEGGSGDYVVAIFGTSDEPFYTDYVLAIDAYCFQGCAYEPFEP